MTKTREPFFHLTKRTDIDTKKAWIIRIVAFIISMFLCAIVTMAATGKGFDFYFGYFFKGMFGTGVKFWNFLREMAILLIMALAVTPCFKMKYWNIGGEGQVLMGALGCAIALQFFGGKIADGWTIVISILLSLLFSMVWAVLPAIFKAKWNTNETLLTLMMNYIATCIVLYFIKSVAPKGTGDLSFSQGVVPGIAGNEYILPIIIVAIVTILIAIYLKFSKHGYELTVVGESPNTARYIGINSKKVIIRTLLLCGLICGLAGFMLVSIKNYSIHGTTTVNGRGFTAVLVSWLAHFNPLAMVLTSFLVEFIHIGSQEVSTFGRLGESYPSVMTGIFFLCIIATEFFINYKIVPKSSLIKHKHDDNPVVDETIEEDNDCDTADEESSEEVTVCDETTAQEDIPSTTSGEVL